MKTKPRKFKSSDVAQTPIYVISDVAKEFIEASAWQPIDEVKKH